MSILSKEERDIIGILGEAWNMFYELPVYHPGDQEEFIRAIHAAQNIVLARPATKEMQDTKDDGQKAMESVFSDATWPKAGNR